MRMTSTSGEGRKKLFFRETRGYSSKYFLLCASQYPEKFTYVASFEIIPRTQYS